MGATRHKEEDGGAALLGDQPMPNRLLRIWERRRVVLQKRAFTLVELLVVIAVISVLLAILIPALEKARRQARAAACQVNLRQWGTALALIAEDNEGRFPRNDSMRPEAMTPLWILTGQCLAETVDDHLQAPRQYHYINPKGMLCPEATTPGALSTGGGGWGEGGVTWTYDLKAGGTSRAWVCTVSGGPSEETHVSVVSYGLNGWLFQRPGGPLTPLDRFEAIRSGQPAGETNLFMLRRTGGMPLLLDCTYYSGSPTDECLPPLVENGGNGPMSLFCINRHSERVNALFMDWSVRKVGLKELWTLKWYESFNTTGPWTKAGGVTPDRWPPWMRGFKDY
jgi:prepilin-type N-terminal cleavage/methylation domain-containing protein/prepilin-type processing-associated H-X9-DG protein